jgi:hypothetical protein
MKQIMKPMDEALKTHYAEKTLSEDQLDRLMAMQAELESLPDEAEPQMSKAASVTTSPFVKIRSKLVELLPDFGHNRYVFYAATCVLLTGLILSLSLFNQTSLTERVIDEIAYNHRQEMPVEVAANTMSAIGQYLDRLSFSLISPRALTDNGWQILGGRYCSINGKLAAQLKVKNIAEDKVYTLYQASAEGDLVQTGISMKSGMVDGVDVSIWQEQGLLLGLASSQ